MLQGEEILQTIAEVSIAFAGFTGVVVTFGRRPQGRSSVDSHAFRAMLASSLQGLFFSVLPFFLDALGLAEPALWRVASGFMLLGLGFGALADVRYARRSAGAEWTPPDRALRIIIPVFGVAAMAGQLLNVFGAAPRSFAPYLGGLIFFLLFSSIMFVRLLTGPATEPPETSEPSGRDAQ